MGNEWLLSRARLDFRRQATSFRAGEDAMRLSLLAVLSLAMVSQWVTAAEPLPQQPPKPVAPPVSSQTALSKEQLAHLRAAAEHLTKAGRKEEARKLLEQAATAESGQAAALLARKEKELAVLQTEVEQLRKLARRQPQISLAFQVLQLSRERLKEHDIPNLKLLLRKDAGRVQLEVIENPEAVAELVDDLRKRELVKVLAEPTIVTVSGRPAHFHSGGEMPTVKAAAPANVSIGYTKFGTEFEVVPMVMANERVRLEFRLSVSEADPKKTVKVGDVAIPQLRRMSVDTGAEMQLGQTLVLSGTTEKRVESQVDAHGKTHEVTNHIETIVLVTPRRVDGTEPVIHPQPVGYYVPVPNTGAVPAPLNFGGVIPRVIHQEEEEERLIIK
jgi:hypothetical protein